MQQYNMPQCAAHNCVMFNPDLAPPSAYDSYCVTGLRHVCIHSPNNDALGVSTLLNGFKLPRRGW
jgi:hypothetical protein